MPKRKCLKKLEKTCLRKNPGEILLQQNMTRRKTEHRRLLFHKQHYENVPIRETDHINEAKLQDIARFFALNGSKTMDSGEIY